MWHYMQNNQRIGPVGDNIIRSLIRSGTIVRNTPVWKEGMQDWCAAEKTELQSQFGSVPPTPPPYSRRAEQFAVTPSYSPGSFRILWLWYAWLVGVGVPLWILGVGILSLWGHRLAGSGLAICIINIGVGAFLAIPGTVISYILLYRFWRIIQDGEARTSPGRAVGLCFIPFFSLYWIYIAVVGLAKDMNAFCSRCNIQGPRVNEELALTWFILSLMTLIPYFGFAIAIAVLVIWIILYRQFADTAMRITDGKKL